MTEQNLNDVTILKDFRYDRLPEDLKSYSIACANLAEMMYQSLPPGWNRFNGLVKLLEAKDAFVRAALKARDDV